MIVSEIASGTPRGVTFAEEKLFLLVEAETEEEANEIISDIVDQIKKVKNPTLPDLNRLIGSLRAPSDVTIVLAFQDDTSIHFLLQGQGTVFLKRGNDCVLLLSGIGSATGPANPYDVFILAGPSFLSAITLSVFSILIGKSTAEEVEQHIATYIEQQSSEGSICLLLHKSDESPVVEPVINVVPPPSTVRPVFALPRFGALSFFSRRISSLSPNNKSQRMTLLAGCVLLFLLIASLIFGSTQRDRIASSQKLEEIVALVNRDLGEAEKLIDLSPEQAEPLISQAHDVLTLAQTEFPTNSAEQTTLTGLLEKTESLSQKARRIYTVSPDVFFDIKWLKETGHGEKIALTAEAFFLTDPANKSIYKVGLPQKKPEILATKDVFTQSTAIAASLGNPYVFVEGSDPKVTNAKGDTIIPKNDNWGPVKDIASFGGNIYLLDTNGAIWKHTPTESGFGSGSRWLGENVTVDFQNARSLAIDGSIWVLTTNGITKLTMGGIDPFFLKGESIQNGKEIWTSDTAQSLFVLENDRIVVFNKEGKYDKQYLWDRLPTVTDFTVAESLNKILLVKGDTVFSIDINQ